MGTLHGKDSILYMNDGSAAAVQISEAASWTLDLDFDEDPDPALGDAWETRLKGLLRFTLSATGNLDDAQDTLWDAEIATAAAKFYLYIDKNNTGRYYYGSCWPKASISGGVAGKETFSLRAAGTGQLAKNPA